MQILLASALVVGLPNSVMAQAAPARPQCDEYESIVEAIAARPYNEHQAGQGQGKLGPMELWLSDDGATWSWILWLSDGVHACLIDAGTTWRPAPGTKT